MRMLDFIRLFIYVGMLRLNFCAMSMNVFFSLSSSLLSFECSSFFHAYLFDVCVFARFFFAVVGVAGVWL